ncbi:MAG: hypothetical protein PHT07_10250 [Paludibacter sp.]|nr:hypothetical protein [Paludibacter sp.]
MKKDVVFKAQINLIRALPIPSNKGESLAIMAESLIDIREHISSLRIRSEQGQQRVLEVELARRLHKEIFGDSVPFEGVPSAHGLCTVIAERFNDVGAFAFENLHSDHVEFPEKFSYADRDFWEVKKVVEAVLDEVQYGELIGLHAQQ